MTKQHKIKLLKKHIKYLRGEIRWLRSIADMIKVQHYLNQIHNERLSQTLTDAKKR